jgi:chromate transporter
MTEPDDDARPRQLATPALFWLFLKLGATAFGGLGAALAILEKELVARRGLLQADDLTDALAATRLLPGSSLAQVVSFLGFRLRGWGGSALALLAFLLPSTLAMLLLAVLRDANWFLPVVGRVSHGLSAAVVGLLLASVIRFARSSLRNPAAWLGAAAAFGLGAATHLGALVIVLGAGALGALGSRCRRRRPEGSAGTKESQS